MLKRIGGVGAATALAGCSVREQGNGGSEGETASGDGSGDGASGGSQQSGGTATPWHQLPDSEIPAREDAMETFASETEFGVDGSDISDMDKTTTSAIPAEQGPEADGHTSGWATTTSASSSSTSPTNSP